MRPLVGAWIWLIVSSSGVSWMGLCLKQSTPKVVGGQNASAGEFPFLVSIQCTPKNVHVKFTVWNFGNGSKAVHFCGGTIVDRYWILTAAHCKETVFENGWLEVAAGEYDLQHDEGFEQRRNVSEFLVHEKRLSGFVGPNDIALIRLREPLELTTNITAVRLDDRQTPIYGYAILPGWGSTSSTFELIYPEKLQKAYLPVFPYDACLQYFPLFSPLEETNFCAGELSGTVNACHRDSGGPLLQTIDEVVTQIGIVSWGALPCTAYRSPTVVTWVSCFRDWVRTTIERNSIDFDSFI